MTALRSQLDQIANQLVSSIVTAVEMASLDELMNHAGSFATTTRGATTTSSAAKPRDARGRRPRSTAEEVQQQKAVALAAAKSLKPGFSKGDVMRKSRSTVDLGRALSLLVADGRLSKKGDRRKTRYSVK